MAEVRDRIAMTHHDLRGTIHAIQAFLAVVLAERAGPLTDVQRDYLSSAYAEAKRLADQVEVLPGDLGHGLVVLSDQDPLLSP